MSETQDILNYLKAIASQKLTAVEELGYNSNGKDNLSQKDSDKNRLSDTQYFIAISMLVLSSINGISEGSLDVPNQSGLAYLDNSNGVMYHGPQKILVSLCMIANTVITIQQLIKSRRETDSVKIHEKRQAQLKRLHNLLSVYFVENKNDHTDIVNRFTEAYKKALHIDVQKRLFEYKVALIENHDDIITNVELVRLLPNLDNEIKSPEVIDKINKKYINKYQGLLNILNELDVLYVSDRESYNNNNADLLIQFLKSFSDYQSLLDKSVIKRLHAFSIKDNDKVFYDELYDVLKTKKLRQAFINEVIYLWIHNEILKAQSPDSSDNEEIFDDISLFNLDDFARSLEINPQNHEYIGDSNLYNGTKYLGYSLGWINVAVNFGIGIGAFVSFSMIIYALTGISIIALIGSGWPLMLAILFFAFLSMMMPFLITRIYINQFFENFAYNFKLWWDSKKTLLEHLNDLTQKDLITLLVTLPSAIGLSIVGAVAFYVSMPIMPIAILIGVISFIACVSLFGGMFYESYDRLEKMITKINYQRLAVPAGIATIIMVAIGLALFLNPITAPFMALGPVSAMLLMGVISIIVFTMIFAYYGNWPKDRAFYASLGLTAAVGQSIAIFCYTALLFSNPIGLAFACGLAILSFPLFFSWAVMCVALPEDEMERHSILKHCKKNQTADSEPAEQALTDMSRAIIDNSMFEYDDEVLSSESDSLLIDNQSRS
ncbi:MAG: hypothetical protein VX835_03290 [Pseudomonadota bacterium]|nr:hypothetical protein [Pseudomonadota bacterium]